MYRQQQDDLQVAREEAEQAKAACGLGNPLVNGLGELVAAV